MGSFFTALHNYWVLIRVISLFLALLLAIPPVQARAFASLTQAPHVSFSTGALIPGTLWERQPLSKDTGIRVRRMGRLYKPWLAMGFLTSASTALASTGNGHFSISTSPYWLLLVLPLLMRSNEPVKSRKLSYVPMSDEEAMRLYRDYKKGGEKKDAAFQKLLSQYQSLLGKTLNKYNDAHLFDRDDISAEFVARLMSALDTYEPERGTPLLAYLAIRLETGMYTYARTIFNRGKRTGEMPNEEFLVMPEIDDAGISALLNRLLVDGYDGTVKDALSAITTAIDGLSDAQREVADLHMLQGLSYSDISALTGKPESTIRSLMRHALKTLPAKVAKALAKVRTERPVEPTYEELWKQFGPYISRDAAGFIAKNKQGKEFLKTAGSLIQAVLAHGDKVKIERNGFRQFFDDLLKAHRQHLYALASIDQMMSLIQTFRLFVQEVPNVHARDLDTLLKTYLRLAKVLDNEAMHNLPIRLVISEARARALFPQLPPLAYARQLFINANDFHKKFPHRRITEAELLSFSRNAFTELGQTVTPPPSNNKTTSLLLLPPSNNKITSLLLLPVFTALLGMPAQLSLDSLVLAITIPVLIGQLRNLIAFHTRSSPTFITPQLLHKMSSAA